jgi:hypothetical protein
VHAQRTRQSKNHLEVRSILFEVESVALKIGELISPQFNNTDSLMLVVLTQLPSAEARYSYGMHSNKESAG